MINHWAIDIEVEYLKGFDDIGNDAPDCEFIVFGNFYGRKFRVFGHK